MIQYGEGRQARVGGKPWPAQNLFEMYVLVQGDMCYTSQLKDCSVPGATRAEIS